MRVLIDGLPRTGTTTLARLLAIHPATKVIIEPFHPRRYDGAYHSLLLTEPASHPFEFAWKQWNVIKHVWESDTDWPFRERPALKAVLWLSADIVITVSRSNLAKRYISSELSRILRFWIGKRQDFIERLTVVDLNPLNIPAAIRAIQLDLNALRQRAHFMKENNVSTVAWNFEDFYDSSLTDQLSSIQNVYTALGLRRLNASWLRERANQYLDRSLYAWSSREVYDLIPNIEQFDAAVRDEFDMSVFG